MRPHAVRLAACAALLVGGGCAANDASGDGERGPRAGASGAGRGSSAAGPGTAGAGAFGNSTSGSQTFGPTMTAQPDAMLRTVAYGELIDERFAHKTCAYGNCGSLPDPGSIDGVCTYHRADTERYDDGEAWPR